MNFAESQPDFSPRVNRLSEGTRRDVNLEPSATTSDTLDLVHQPEAEAPCLERFVRASVNEVVGVVATTLELSARPWKSPNFALPANPPAHPLSYLLISLFACTVLIDFRFEYYKQPVDATLIEWLTDSVAGIELSRVLVAAGPAFAVALLLAAIVSRAFVKAPSGINCPVVAAACFAVGSQLFLSLLADAFEDQLNTLTAETSEATSRSAGDYLGHAMTVIACLTPAWQLERIALRVGDRWLATCTPARWVTCIAFATAMLFVTARVLVATNASPEKLWNSLPNEHIMGQLRSRVSDQLKIENLGLTLKVDVISSETLHHTEGFVTNRNDGRAILEQTVAITNHGNSRAVIVTPGQLRFGLQNDSHFEATVRESTIGRDDGAWVLAPGETRIAYWILDTPMVGDLNMCGYVLRLPYYELSPPKTNVADRLMTSFDDAEKLREPLIALVSFKSETSKFGIEQRLPANDPFRTAPEFQTPPIPIEPDPWNRQASDDRRAEESWR